MGQQDTSSQGIAEDGAIAITLTVDPTTGEIEIDPSGPITILTAIAVLDLARSNLHAQYFMRAQALAERTKPKIFTSSGPLPNFG